MLSRADPKFAVTRYTTGWAGDHLNWVKQDPLNLSIDVTGLDAATYGGGRILYNYRPVALGTGIAGGVMLAVDGHRLYNAPPHEQFQGTLALTADAATVAGSIVRARYAKLGTVLTGFGMLGRLGTEFVPSGVRLNILE